MKLTCTHHNLSTTLNYLEWVTGKQGYLPILSNILFEASHGQLKLSATNLEIGVVAVVGAKVEQDGKVALPAKLLTHFIQNINPNEVISIVANGNQVVVGNDTDQITLNSVESKDFPIIPEYTGDYPLTLSSVAFDEILKRVVFAASTNENRIELTGIFFSASERGIHVTATDSFRLSEYTLLGMETSEKEQLSEFLTTQGGVILPINTLQELGKILQGEGGSILMAIHDNQVFFQINGIRLVSRVIQGRYPEYQQILPKDFQLLVEVNRQEIVRSLKMATSFAQYGSGEVIFHFSAEKGSLEIKTVSSGVGEQRASITLQEAPSEDREIIFQSRHLLEGVNALSGEKVVFQMNSKDMPVLLRGERAEEQLYLVMPVRK